MTYEEFKALALEAFQAEQRANGAAHDERLARLNVASLEADLEKMETQLSMDAYARGQINGTNEKVRGLQLANMLDTNQGVAGSREAIRQAQLEIASKAHAAAQTKAEAFYKVSLSLAACELVEEA